MKKAFVLAAGLGERLRPLTLKTPKPLLPLDGKPILDSVLQYLKRQNIEEVVINLFHLGEKIQQYVGAGDGYGLRVHYSPEKELLGTGGGLKQAQSWFEQEKEFLITNSDILMDIALNTVLEKHRQQKAVVTLILRKKTAADLHTPITLKNNLITTIGKEGGEYFYTGMMIASPQLLHQLPAGKSCLIRQGIIPLLESGATICGVPFDGLWRDIGTPAMSTPAKLKQ